MNKAFVREPDFDGRVFCPRCGSLGVAVSRETLDHHVQQPARSGLGDSAWFCDYGSCEIAYFDLFERCVDVTKLQRPVYPKDPSAPICACFEFTLDDIDADIRSGTPTRIRELISRSESDAAQCQTLAADGRCCIREVQRLYMRKIAEESR